MSLDEILKARAKITATKPPHPRNDEIITGASNTDNATDNLIENESANFEANSGSEKDFGVAGEAETSAISSDESLAEGSADIGTTVDETSTSTEEAISTPAQAVEAAVSSPIEDVVHATILHSETTEGKSEELVVSPTDEQVNVKESGIASSEPTETVSESVAQHEDIASKVAEALNDTLIPQDATEEAEAKELPPTNFTDTVEELSLPIAELIFEDIEITQDQLDANETSLITDEASTITDAPTADEAPTIVDTPTSGELPTVVDVATTAETPIVVETSISDESQPITELVQVHGTLLDNRIHPADNEDTSADEDDFSLKPKAANDAFVSSILALPNGAGQGLAERNVNEELVALHVAPSIEPPSPKRNKQSKKSMQAQDVVAGIVTPAKPVNEGTDIPAEFLIEIPLPMNLL